MADSATVRLPREGAHTDPRRQQRIDAAMNSIAERGLANVTVSRVAEAAGISLGFVNFYFENCSTHGGVGSAGDPGAAPIAQWRKPSPERS